MIVVSRKYFVNFLLIIFLGVCSQGYTQKMIVVFDSISKKPVRDAYLFYKKESKIILLSYSNEKGEMLIPNDSKDPLSISHVGYATKLFNILENLKTIELIPRIQELDSVSITSFREKKSKVFGHYKKKGETTLCTSTPGWLVGTTITIDTSIKRFRLKKLFCEFEKSEIVQAKNSKCKIGVIFRFFLFNKSQPIANDIVDPVIVDYDKIKENFKFNLNDFTTILNKYGQIFIGVEWQTLSCSSNTDYIKQFYLKVNYSSEDNQFWYYNLTSNKWHQSKNGLTSGTGAFSVEISY